MLEGLRGLWTGNIIGMINQTLMYIVIIYCITKWGKVAEERAAERQGHKMDKKTGDI